MSPQLHALILAGGLGTRLWPMSRASRPKQFLDMGLGKTMFQLTCDRVSKCVPFHRIWVITRPEFCGEVAREVPGLERTHILAEPYPRGTAAAVAWGTQMIRDQESDAVVAVFPSDHQIDDEVLFCQAIGAAVQRASESVDLVTLGLTPRWPETQYGYLEPGEELGRYGGTVCRRVVRFHEKPSEAEAEAYFRSGVMLWNSGIFIFNTEAFEHCLYSYSPGLLELARQVASGNNGDWKSLAPLYRQMPETSWDQEVLEHAGCISVFSVDFGWRDMGLWKTHMEKARYDKNHNHVSGKGLVLEGRDNFLYGSEGKMVTVMGLDGVAVILEGDAVVVCPRDKTADIGKLVKEMDGKGFKEFL